MTRTRAAHATFAGAMLVSFVACGSSAEDRLTAASDAVGEIRSGILDMRLSVASTAAPDAPIGFTIRGPFEVRDEGLEADLRYRQIVGAAEAEVRFVSTEGRAFVESEGAFYELPVVEDVTASRAPTVLQELDFAGWAAAPTIVGSEQAEQVTITSPLVAERALEGLGRLFDELDMSDVAGLAVLRGVDGDAVARSVRDGRMTVRVGRDDDLLRALVVRLRFGLDPSSPLADVLGGSIGAHLLFSVEIADPNGPVRVETPADPLPISELPGA